MFSNGPYYFTIGPYSAIKINLPGVSPDYFKEQSVTVVVVCVIDVPLPIE